MAENTCAYCGGPAARKYCSRKCFHLARRKSESVTVTCPCGQPFETTTGLIAKGRGKYCSQACKYRYRTRPSGLVYNITRENPTAFKPGDTPWNKGMKGIWLGGGSKPGEHSSPATEFKSGETAGAANFRWAGGPGHRKSDLPGYVNLHYKVHRERGRAADYPCTMADATCRGPMHWANISGQYLDVEDFMPLCTSHHFRYDGGTL